MSSESERYALLARVFEAARHLSEDERRELDEQLKSRTLSKNRKFLNVMKACDPDEDNPPEAIFFVDLFCT